VGGDNCKAAYDVFLIVLILLDFKEWGRIKPSLIVALVDFRSEEISRTLLFGLCSRLLFLVLVI
jgi:hypothetical protein